MGEVTPYGCGVAVLQGLPLFLRALRRLMLCAPTQARRPRMARTQTLL